MRLWNAYSSLVGIGLFTWLVVIGSGRAAQQPQAAGENQLYATYLPLVISQRQQLAFSSVRDNPGELYLLDYPTGIPVRLTDNFITERTSLWSPDGENIAFETDDSRGLYVLNLQDSQPGSLVDLTGGVPGEYMGLAWAPDSARLAFTSNRDQQYYELYLVDADGTDLVRLTDNAVNELFPAWSPDGNRLLFLSGLEQPNLYVMEVDGSGVTQLTDLAERQGVASPQWSPDGQWILYSLTHPLIEEPNLPTLPPPPPLEDFYLVSPDGTQTIQLTEAACVWPQWSPDGRWIACLSYAMMLEDSELLVMAADGSGLRQVATSISGIFTYDWSPDSRKIAFSAYRQDEQSLENFEIFVFNLYRGSVENVTRHPADDYFPNWRP